MTDWQPGASAEILKRRARLLAEIRQFFADREVMEVDTPVLARHSVTDVHLDSFAVDIDPGQSPADTSRRYLQTSPEYAMKRLLAAGSGPIYQLGKAFRREQPGRLHNPEFTLLEWYRPGFNWRQLMTEVADLVTRALQLPASNSIASYRYGDLFEEHLAINPHTISAAALERLTRSTIDVAADDLSTTDCLQLLMHHCIEPRLPDYCFVYDYPEAQAALAVVENNDNGIPVARRFELYGGGMELANGYQELTNPEEQRRRFERDQAERSRRGLPAIAADERLLAALQAGLPSCAGVALGIDRLLMLACGARDIGDVIAFPDARA